MHAIPCRKEKLDFADTKSVPAIDVRFGACRADSKGNFFDIVDFNARSIERWHMPQVDVQQATRILNSQLAPEKFPGNPEFFVKEMLSTHVLQISPYGRLFINRGNFLSGTSFSTIDQNTGAAHVMIDAEGEVPYFYTATGGFSADGSRWYFARWPLQDTIDILSGKATEANLEIGAVDVKTGAVSIEHLLRNDDRIHQVSPCPDGRHLVFTSFKSDMRVAYPRVAMEQDPAGYRRSHEAGIIPVSVVTLDMQTGRHWKTEVPVAVSAHMEFDPADPLTFFVSGHNFAINHQPNVIIEGPGAIIQMRIGEGETKITGVYAPGDLYRVSQHVPFRFDGRTLIAVTNTPNKLDLVDGQSMTLWRREELFPFPPLDLSLTGSCVSPMPAKAFFSINPSRDGRYIVLENSENFHFYSLEEGRFLDVTMPRFLPADGKGTGHTRIAGR